MITLQAACKKIHMKLLLIFSFIQLVILQVHAQSADETMKQVMVETGAVGISVAVVKDGKMIFTGAYGYKDLENKVKLESNHLFRIASISKSFTATSIMQLVEKGKISLDEDVSKLIGFTVRNPKYPEKVITLRLMLSHLSSINDSQGYFNLDIIDSGKNPNWSNAYSDYSPGTKFQYCNLNFNMIGAIIEKISNQRFDDYIIDHVLRPLGLQGGYDVSKLDSSQFARIYEYKSDIKKYMRSEGAYAVRPELNEGYIMGRTTPVFSPTGGMKISAPDLGKYMLMHMKMGRYKGKRILSKESEALMRQPVSLLEPYGFALETTNKMIPGETLIGHTGVAYGQFSAMFFHPKKQYGIVVLINGCPPEYDSGYNAVIRKTVNQLYASMIETSKKKLLKN
jgi:CubicO group peptidase (beta-lactamase class C family)